MLYFARLKESLGVASERIALPQAVSNLDGLRALLVARGGVWTEELAVNRRIRAAVNQTMAAGDTAISDGDEIAFFPPVTGG